MRLYPIFHPAAALYTPRMLETLREDFSRLPELLALGAPEQPDATECPGGRPAAARAAAADWRTSEVRSGARAGRIGPAEADQLGLF